MKGMNNNIRRQPLRLPAGSADDEEAQTPNARAGAVAIRLPVSAGKPPDALPLVRYLSRQDKNKYEKP